VFWFTYNVEHGSFCHWSVKVREFKEFRENGEDQGKVRGISKVPYCKEREMTDMFKEI